MQIPTGSESFRKLNKHLFPSNGPWEPQEGPNLSQGCPTSGEDGLGHGSTPKTAPKRIRQGSKPVLNRLESEFYETIRNKYPNYPTVRCQAKRYELARGMWYKPDFTCSTWPATEGTTGPAMETAWEVKGQHAFRGGFEALKMAARVWPEVRFLLVWKMNGQWQSQRILA